MLIKSLNQISKEDISLMGGKGAFLGELIKAGLPVPSGFVISTEIYKQGLTDKIEQKILQAFDNLGADRVAVRSSAIAEDSSNASWAGQLESYLNVTREGLIIKVQQCWDSINSERALSYASQVELTQNKVAVVVQKMVDSEVAGVMFTKNPITNDQSEIMIEACFGLGEMLVQGEVTPDNFLVNKSSLEIKEKNIDTQDKMMVFQVGQNKEVPVPENKRSEPKLNDTQIKELAKLAVKIEKHFGRPQDIEWALEKGNIYILQSRPITT